MHAGTWNSWLSVYMRASCKDTVSLPCTGPPAQWLLISIVYLFMMNVQLMTAMPGTSLAHLLRQTTRVSGPSGMCVCTLHAPTHTRQPSCMPRLERFNLQQLQAAKVDT